MIKTFGTIEEFIKIKDKCIFCQNSLTTILTNQSINNFVKIAELNAYVKNNKFEFVIKYDGERLNFDAFISIDIIDNKFNYYIKSGNYVKKDDVARIFIGMKPYIELVCENGNCDMEYYLQSDCLNCYDSPNAINTIRPISLLAESFAVKDWYIYNFYHHRAMYNAYEDKQYSTTLIQSKYDPESKPLLCPRLDFEAQPKQKLIDRIKTIVVFS
jgi:hypothetical protein